MKTGLKNSFLFLAFLCLYFQLNAQVNIKKATKGLDKEIQEVLADWNAAGVAVAIVGKDGPLYTKGYGYRDYENKIPVDENTLFAIGSCTKAFTSGLLGLYAEEGKIKLTDSPTEYVPGLKFYNTELNSQVSIEDLMAHRTGIPRHDFAWYIFPTKSRDSLVMRIRYQEPFTGVRENWYYNNFMFLVQGVIAEKIGSQTWEKQIESKFFEPLNMSRSSATIEGLKTASNAAFGYTTEKDKIVKMNYYDIAAMAPAGSINSSATEMSNWVQTWINAGKFNGNEVLPASYTKSAMSSKSVINAGLPSSSEPGLHMANYGYGWMLSSYKGHYRVEHGGNIDGFSASTSFFPSDSLGIVVLTNQNGSAITSIIRNIISDRILGVEKTDWNGQLKKQREEGLKMQSMVEESSSKVEGTNPSHSLNGFTGYYENKGYGKFKILLRNDSLIADFGKEKLWLEHYHYDQFKPYFITPGRPDSDVNPLNGIFFSFTTGLGGDIEKLNLNIEPALTEPIPFTREPIAMEMEAQDLEKFTGNYQLGPQSIKMYTKGDVLYTFIPGQPEYELTATGKNTFNFKALKGFKIEFEETDGKVTAAKIIQPNGTFKAQKKD